MRDRRIKHGGKGTQLYGIWVDMRFRCFNPKSAGWAGYGGRGITVCDEWKDDFLCFKAWAMANGYNNKLTIDRIDNDGSYTPENCRWATPLEQGANKRNNRWLTYKGETKTLKQWVRELNIPKTTLTHRLDKYGDNLDLALAEPVKEKRDKYLVSYRGVAKTVGEWAKIIGVPTKSLRWHLDKCNDNMEAAMNIPFIIDGKKVKVGLPCITRSQN